MCWCSGTVYSPTRRVSCLSRSLNLVCKILKLLSSMSETNTIGYIGRIDEVLTRRQAFLQQTFVDDLRTLGFMHGGRGCMGLPAWSSLAHADPGRRRIPAAAHAPRPAAWVP